MIKLYIKNEEIDSLINLLSYGVWRYPDEPFVNVYVRIINIIEHEMISGKTANK